MLPKLSNFQRLGIRSAMLSATQKEELEKKIEREGVPVDEHGIWEDSMEWRNAVEEVERLKKLLKELK